MPREGLDPQYDAIAMIQDANPEIRDLKQKLADLDDQLDRGQITDDEHTKAIRVAFDGLTPNMRGLFITISAGPYAGVSLAAKAGLLPTLPSPPFMGAPHDEP